MKLMSLFKGLVLAAMLACVAHAEQRVVVLDSRNDEPVNLAPVSTLLSQGWRIVLVSTGGAGSGHFSITQRILITFVLESPTEEIK